MSGAARLAAAGWLAAAVLASAGVGRACPRRVVLDLDPIGDFDDLSALWVAAVSPELDLAGVVVTSGDPETSERAAARALAVVGRDELRIHRGVTPPAERPALNYWSQFPARDYEDFPELSRFSEGVSFTPDRQAGVDFYLETALASQAGVSIVTGSSLTTLAAALREADRRGVGDAFRAGVACVLVSGGDFRTAEWNVFADVPAAREVLASGIPIYQFGGEDEPKSRLHHAERARLWSAETPLTWTLQDFYRLYHAGNDPTAPYVPILYDVHPLAFLIEGERAARFEPMAVSVDDTGHLVRGPGTPNLMSRIPGSGGDLVDWILARLDLREPPAAAHLEAIRRLAASAAAPPPGLAPALDAASALLRAPAPPDAATARAKLAALGEQLAGLGELAPDARRHLELAQKFLLGDPRPDAWRDPYTDGYIRMRLLWMRASHVSKRKLAAVLALGALALLAVAHLRGRRRAAAGRVA